MRIFSAVILVAALTHAATAAEYYVSLRGNDANAGTMPQPFATLAQAQRPPGVWRVARPCMFLREGTHYLGETLVFSAEDSGTQATSPVVYQAFEQEQAVLLAAACG